MKERAEHLPKEDNQRNAIARRIRRMRQIDRATDTYTLNRTGSEYLHALNGLEHLFRYVRGLKSNIVLDIGAGRTKGAHNLSQSTLGTGLDFRATVLSQSPAIQSNLGHERTHHTSAEILRGIDTESVACALGVMSLTYSANFPLVAASIDRVLVPGGILKTVLRTDKTALYAPDAQLPEDFGAAFKNLGYDVDEKKVHGNLILLAIKPGGPAHAGVTANGLMERDTAGAETQIRTFDSE